MEEDKIKYSDIIQPDDSIEKLIGQLGELNGSYETLVNAVRAGADRVVHALKTVSGATQEGRKAIEDAASTAAKLKRVQDSVATSYDKINADLKDHVRLWKSLSAEERAQVDMGQQIKSEIINLKEALKSLDEQLKAEVPTLTELEKAEKKLSYVRSDEYTQLLKIKQEISEVVAAKKTELNANSKVEAAQDKLNDAYSIQNLKIKEYEIQTRRANKIAELQAKIAVSSAGSYDNLSAKYELAKLRLNEMGAAERKAGTEAEALEKELKALYNQMSLLQKKTGKHTLDVGNYAKAWSGLGFSVQQVVRELPSLAINAQTFFLAISNNIPMVIDEINRLRNANKAAIATGKPTTSIIKTIVSSLFSWQTALVVVLSALSIWGNEIVDWIEGLFEAKDAVISLDKATRNIAKELKDTNANYGSTVVQLKKLQDSFKSLRTEAEKKQWVIDHRSEVEKMGVGMKDVNEAELIFIKHTEAVISALQLRAKAEAARKLASEEYAKSLVKRNEAETTAQTAPSFAEGLWYLIGAAAPFEGATETATRFEKQVQSKVANLNKEADAAEKTADAYYEIAKAQELAASSVLKDAGLGDPHKKGPKDRTPSEGRDLTERVYKTALDIQKKYEQSITALERDEFELRKKEITDKKNAEIRALQDTYRKTEDYLNDTEGKYKDLTDEEIRIIRATQHQIKDTILFTREALELELEQIELERQARELEIQQETINLKLQAVSKGSKEEYLLMKRSLEKQRQLALTQNKLLPANQRQDVSVINASFDKQGQLLTGSFELNQFDQQQALARAKFDTAERTEREITKFTLEQEKERWEKQIQLAMTGGLDWSQEQVDTANATVIKINTELSKLDDFWENVSNKGLVGALLENLGFNDAQINAFNSFTDTIIDNINAIIEAEIEAAEKAVEIAEERVEAAQKAYDAEVEARANGYANNVATARKELEQEKKKQLQKQKILEAAQRRQEQLDTIMQASSLITASANIWSSFSKIPVVGYALAIAAIAGMWASFAAAKVKAKQVTSSSEAYGEGGLEFLEGGSHASGNDIDLGVDNKRNKRMRAEGGEAMAIINKRSTRRYRRALPDIIESLNKGVFEDKYINAFASGNDTSLTLYSSNNNIDLSAIENDVRAIRNQDRVKYYFTQDGHLIIVNKNVKRIIKS